MPEIEEIDDVPDLEEIDPQGGEQNNPEEANMMADKQQNRNEKKSRKALQKLGMRQINGIVRVTVKKAKSVLFVIHQPDVFKSPTAETYVIFGEAKSDDSNAASHAAAAKQFQAMQQAAAAAPAAPQVVEEAVDETGIEPKDIDLVMNQAGCTRAAAVKALKENDGDLVNSIMSLS